jgi:hypothetical protein
MMLPPPLRSINGSSPVLLADDFLPEQDWRVLASVGYMWTTRFKDRELETAFAKQLGAPLLLANVSQQARASTLEVDTGAGRGPERTTQFLRRRESPQTLFRQILTRIERGTKRDGLGGVSLGPNLREIGRQPGSRHRGSPHGVFRAKDRARSASRGLFGNGREPCLMRPVFRPFPRRVCACVRTPST